MSLKEIKQLAEPNPGERRMQVSLVCFVKVSGGLEILSAHESQDDAQAQADIQDSGKVGAEKYKVVTLEVQKPQLVQNRADILNIVDRVWPDCPPEVRNGIGGPINACDWAGETVETVTAAVKLAKKEYKKKPYTPGNNPPKLGKRRRLRRQHRQ